MKLRNKKGFTIIELVIVIAVIGILTAVLVPTFINLTNKANQAADESLVKNLNTALKMEEQTPGHKKAPTLQGAIDDLKEQGYLLENLVSKSGQDLLWNQEKNEFVLNNNAELKDGNYWQIVDAIPAEAQQRFSYYAGQKFTATEVNPKYGFDAGENTKITTVNYNRLGATAGQTVNIRTNDTEYQTELNINAPLDVVNHYGYLTDLDISAIAGASYHEYGKLLGKATVSQGHFVVEAGASVPEIVVEEIPTGKTVQVTANAGTLVNVDSSSSSSASVVANNENVYVSGLTEDKISGTKAETVKLPDVVTNEEELAAAVAANKSYIQLGADFETTEGYEYDVNTMFDFAGHTITSSLVGAPFITNKSTLTIVDTGSQGGIVSANNIIAMNKGIMTINSGKFVSNRLYTITQSNVDGRVNRGVINNAEGATITINNIEVSVKADFGFVNFGYATINNGIFNSTSESGAFTDSRWAYCVSQYGDTGTLTINNVVVNAVHGCIGINGGKATINNATCAVDKNKNSYYAVYIAGEVGYPEVIINGGTYTGKTNSLYVGNKSDGGAGNLAMTNVFGGTFNGSINVVLNSANNYGLGMLKIYGGSFGINPENISGKSLVVDGHSTTHEGDYWVVR